MLVFDNIHRVNDDSCLSLINYSFFNAYQGSQSKTTHLSLAILCHPETGLFSCLILSPIILQRHWVLTDTSTFRSQTYNIPFYSYPLSYVIISLTPQLPPFSFLRIKSDGWYKAQLSYHPIRMLVHHCSPHRFTALLILYVYTDPVHILVITFTQPLTLSSIQHIFIEYIL